jgi:hypothetical protein
MTPKEKAEELVALFEYEDNLGIADNTGIEGIDKKKAKQCALITVDEIQKIKSVYHDDTLYDYLEEVKQEIINL